MIDRLGPTPVVSRREILRAWDPTVRGSARARFQTLRDKRVVSVGITRPVTGNRGRFSGSIHVFSTLNRDSVRLYRQGHLREARNLALEAADLEATTDFQQLAGILAAYAARNGEALQIVADFPWRVMRDLELMSAATQQMLLAMAQSAETVRRAHQAMAVDVSRMVGLVSTIQRELAWIRSASGTFTLPTTQLRELGLNRVGAAVEVEWEQVEPGEVIVSTTGAIGGSLEQGPGKRWDTFNPPARLAVSKSRYASLVDQLEHPLVVIPSIPIPQD